MDNFREWLSDNLRYIMLGVAIIAVLLVLFFGFRFLSSWFGGSQSKEEQQSGQQVEQEGTDTQDTQEGTTPEVTDTPEETTPEVTEAPENPEEALTSGTDGLEKSGDSALNTLIQSYYTALGNKDISGLRGLLDELPEEDAQAIANSEYIEGYSDVEVYAQSGLTDASYVVFACYGHKYAGYDTILPGMSCLYVDTRDDGSLYIVAEPTQEEEDWITEAINAPACQELLSARQTAYDETLAQDPALSQYLTSLGVKESAAMGAENGSTITVRSNCNVRAQASADSDKLGELAAGQEVIKVGEEGDWIQIEFDGKTGYVRGDLFS